MNCGSCGSENRADARFCAFCGASLQVPVDERRFVSVVFADLVGFTTLSEHLDPERVKGIVDRAFERLVQDIHDFGGRVDKIVGDAIVALFGAPVAHEDDAERAVRAALRMHETLAEYAVEADVEIRMRIGVNSGEVLVGALRAGGDYTAMGDVVNTASRLETSANPGEVLVGPATYQATRDVIGYESRGSLIVRGREGAVEVWAAREALQPPGYRPRRIAPIVGRESEVALIRHLCELSMRNRRAQSLVVLGEAGVGKTRLVDEVLPIMLGIDPRTVSYSGRCVAYGESNPWWPIAEVLREACSVDPGDPLAVARDKCRASVAEVMQADAVDDVTARLLRLLGYDEPARPGDPSRGRTDLASGFLAFVEAMLRQRPVLIRLADLHWADQVVIDLVDEMMIRLARRPLVFVATGRRTLSERWAPATGRHNTLVLNLGPLQRSASEQLLDSILDESTPQSVRDMVLDRSGGNPLYLEELATLMGSHADAAAAWHPKLEELPDTLRGLIAARIDDLTADEQGVLADASVWGAEGPVSVLRELGETMRGRRDTDQHVAALSLKDVLVADGETWRFRSDLLREVTYSRLTKNERLRRHRGIANYLDHAATGAVDRTLVETLARHYGEAARLALELDPARPVDETHDRAVHWVGEAARIAAKRESWSVAERLFDSALELADHDRYDRDRLGLLTGRGMVRSHSWDLSGATSDAERAAALAERLDDEHGRAMVDLVRGMVDSRGGDLAVGNQRFDRAIERFGALGEFADRAEALRLKGMAALVMGDAAAAESPIEEAADAFESIADRRGRAWAVQNLAWIAFVTGRISLAEQRLAQASEAFQALGDVSGLSWCDGLLAFVRYHQGHFEEANELGRDIFESAKRRGDRWAQAMMLVVVGATEMWMGHATAAAKRASHAVQLFERMNDDSWLKQAISLEARSLAASGRVELSLERLELLRSIVEADGWRRQPLMITSAAMSTRVLLGLPQEPEIDELVAGLADPNARATHELLTAATLAAAQRGHFDLASTLAGRIVQLDETPPDDGVSAGSVASNGFGYSAQALVAAAVGDAATVRAIAADAEAPATYIDRALVAVAVALLRGEDWYEHITAAEKAVHGTDDVCSQGIVALAKAMVADSVGHHDAVRWAAVASELWSSVGADPDGWRVLFRAACSVPAPTS